MPLLSIDAGTGSVRAVIFTPEGEQLASVGQEWVHRTNPRYPGSMDFDTAANFEIISLCIRGALAKAGLGGVDISAVSASSMREGFVLYDGAGTELWACANVDARASAEVSELRELFPELEARSYHSSGQTFALSAQPRLLWLKKNQPDLFERARSMGMISDWILTKLSGVLSSEPSNASSSGIFSLAERTWAQDLAIAAGLRGDIFPPMVESGTIIGEVTAQAAERSGLRKGTPVAAGGGDAQLAAVGLGVVAPGDTAIVGGSFWQQMVNIDSLRTDPDMRIRIDAHAIPGLWQAEGISFNPGIAVRWFRDAFGQSEIAEAAARGIDPYSVLSEKAAMVPPGSHGVVPIFSDTMNYAAWIHAAPSFLNLSLDPEKSGVAVLFRALMENAAVVSRSHLDIIASFTGETPQSVIFAGGAAKSDLWAQIVADVLQVPVQIPVLKEATALGTALCAAVAVGSYSSLAEAGIASVKWDRIVEPNPSNKSTYDEGYERWLKSYPPQLELVKDGVTEAMWRAPGI